MRYEKKDLLICESSDIIVEGLKSSLDGSKFNIFATLSSSLHLEDRINVYHPDILLINPTLLQTSQPLVQLQLLKQDMSIVALVYQYVDPSLLSQFRTIVDINMSVNKIGASLLASLNENEEPSGDTTENYDLSSREIDILVLVAKGMSSKEIADKLFISVNTVNTHRKNITSKTGIKSVAGLTVYAMLHNLL